MQLVQNKTLINSILGNNSSIFLFGKLEEALIEKNIVNLPPKPIWIIYKL